MNFSVLSWNVIGLGRYEKRLLVKDIMNTSSVEMLFKLELKMKSIPHYFMR